jgi:hypothetical protein
MSRLEAGDIAEAWEDLLACHRLVRLVGQAPEYIPKLRSFGLEAQVIDSDQALLTSPALTTTQARQCLSDLDQLPPLASIVEAVDNVSRLEFADCVQWLARGRTGVLADLADEPAQDGNTGQDGRTMLNAVIDWNVVLRMGNKHYDAVVLAMRIPDYATRSAELKRLSTSKRPPDLPFAVTLEGRLIEKALTGGRENATRAAGEVLLVYLALSFDQAQAAQDRAHARERLARIGFALAAYRRARGEYPEEQDLLVPGYLSESLLDSFTDLPFHYRRTDTDGFLLYSVGDNMQDDGGATSDSRPRADDLAIAVPIVPR